jgi:hypothetical protein
MNILKIGMFSSIFCKFANELEGKYIAIHLPSESKRQLLTAVPPKFGIQVGKKKMPGNIFADHVTIETSPSEDLLGLFGEGERIPIEIVGECYDDKAQAVIVSLPKFFDDYIRQYDRLPHITVSTNQGTAPIYSNELILNGTNFTPVNLIIPGYVKFLKGKG